MKPYKGIMRISCTAGDMPCPMKLRHNVQPECIACGHAVIEVLNLEDKVICTATLAAGNNGGRTKAALEKPGKKSAPAKKAGS